CLAIANVYERWTWRELEDGVLWSSGSQGVTAIEVAQGSPAAQAGIRAGDILSAIGTTEVKAPSDVTAILHASTRGTTLPYTVLRLQTPELLTVPLDFIPSGARGLYYVLAAVGIFALLVGATVRLRRPENQATLHFFWLSVAFFGLLAFSFSGRLD